MTFGDNFILEGLRLPSVRERVEAGVLLFRPRLLRGAREAGARSA